MNQAILTSDYAPDTKMVMTQGDGGDISINIIGDGEMRVAASGGKLHGWRLVSILKTFRHIIDLFNGDKSHPKRWVNYPEEGRYELYLDNSTPAAVITEVNVYDKIRYTFSAVLTDRLLKSDQILPANTIDEAKRILEKQLADVYESLLNHSEDDIIRYRQYLISLEAGV